MKLVQIKERLQYVDVHIIRGLLMSCYLDEHIQVPGSIKYTGVSCTGGALFFMHPFLYGAHYIMCVCAHYIMCVCSSVHFGVSCSELVNELWLTLMWLIRPSESKYSVLKQIMNWFVCQTSLEKFTLGNILLFRISWHSRTHCHFGFSASWASEDGGAMTVGALPVS